jgi:hypothetical protein
MRFLLAGTEQELEELAMTDPTIRRAADALRELSQDSSAQELARQRELSQLNLKIMRQCEFEAGRAEGREAGRAEGEARAILAILEAQRIAATEEQRREILTCMDQDRLDKWLRLAITLSRVDELFEIGDWLRL